LEKISECVRKEGLKNFLKEMEDFNWKESDGTEDFSLSFEKNDVKKLFKIISSIFSSPFEKKKVNESIRFFFFDKPFSPFEISEIENLSFDCSDTLSEFLSYNIPLFFNNARCLKIISFNFYSFIFLSVISFMSK
jgi:hypothetical protein